jgi:hypothetical protein
MRLMITAYLLSIAIMSGLGFVVAGEVIARSTVPAPIVQAADMALMRSLIFDVPATDWHIAEWTAGMRHSDNVEDRTQTDDQVVLGRATYRATMQFNKRAGIADTMRRGAERPIAAEAFGLTCP